MRTLRRIAFSEFVFDIIEFVAQILQSRHDTMRYVAKHITTQCAN